MFAFFPSLCEGIRASLLQKVLESNSRNLSVLVARHAEHGAAVGAALAPMLSFIDQFGEP